MKFTDHMVQLFSEIFSFWDIVHIFWPQTKRTFTPLKFDWKGDIEARRRNKHCRPHASIGNHMHGHVEQSKAPWSCLARHRATDAAGTYLEVRLHEQ
jgi:hypothetical protein